ncbi:ATP-binding cassette subfamily B protein [Acidovorax soli]|uniref:ATP-binding cassette subfamily B protein n=1 Tax=Acidovorax soli TaxID=592050 RepID=A0A7X0PB61_9BURK|nr:ABC transporter ATP-binding protein [Acidovorax soli]MBB6558367.1 ATP-binding cassette subfamily B protein [Acidovorax soli]
MSSAPHKPLGFAGLIGMAPWALLGASLLAIASAALSLAPFYVLYRMALAIFAPVPDTEAIRHLALLAVAAIALRWLMMAASHALAHLGAFSVLFQLRLRLARQLARVPMDFFARHGSGSLRKTVVDDTGAMEGFLAHMLPDVVASLTVPLAALALMAAMDWRLTLAALAPLPVAVLLQAVLLRDSGERMREWHGLQAGIATQIVEFLRGMPVVKVFGLSAQSFGRLDDAIQGAVRWVDRYSAGSAGGWAMFMALLSANLVVVAPLGAWLHARGQVDAATLVLFLLVAPLVLQPLLRLTFAFGEQARRAEALRRIGEVLAAPVLRDVPGAQAPALAVPHGIAFDNVEFAYGDGVGEAQALQGISFEAPAGRVTALVGPSGAGKSTVARLLPRLHEVSGGAVRVAGRDVRQWPQAALLSRMAIVFQEVHLFHGTVRDNLRMARPGASDEELVAAATTARAHDFIVRLPQGYDTPIGERGARLSGGERQRLSIARALLKDAPIVLLDEAMAHADAENELLIQQALDVACQGRTVLVIAHRLHTVRQAAHIVVLDQGRIAGQGRHEELLAGCALYRQLWRDHEDARDWTLGSELGGAP